MKILRSNRVAMYFFVCAIILLLTGCQPAVFRIDDETKIEGNKYGMIVGAQSYFLRQLEEQTDIKKGGGTSFLYLGKLLAFWSIRDNTIFFMSDYTLSEDSYEIRIKNKYVCLGASSESTFRNAVDALMKQLHHDDEGYYFVETDKWWLLPE